MTSSSPRAFQLLEIEQLLDRQPLIVAPDTPVAIAVEQMSRTAGQICRLSESGLDGSSRIHSSCALVLAENQLVGIFTERDLVRLLSEGGELDAIAIAEVMTQPVVTLSLAEAQSISAILSTLRQHQIRHLPITDEVGAVRGIVTQTSIRRAMQPFSFLKLRRVGEVMTREVIQAKASASLIELARQMTQHCVSCVVITETVQRSGRAVQVPIGIVTERDMLQFRSLGMALAKTPAQVVMSTPLFLVHPHDTLWAAHQQMQHRHTRRLVVADEGGGLAGVVTQTNLLRLLDPIEMLEDIEQLQQLSEAQAVQLTESNQQLQTEVAVRRQLEVALQNANRILEERVGIQAAQLVQTSEALSNEAHERRSAQEQLSRAFSVTPSLLCVAGLDGYFKRLNPSFGKILGYDDTDLLAAPFVEFVHPEDRAATLKEVERLAAGKTTIAFKNRYRCKDGRYRWLNWSATVDLNEQTIFAAATDITELKQLEDDLRQERNFISAIVDTAGALVIVIDNTGRIVRFNNACQQISGYTAAEIADQKIWDVLIPAEEAAGVRAVFQELTENCVSNRYENHWIRKDGTRRLIQWSNTILTGESGRVDYVVGTGIDITEQRQAEQELTRQYQQSQLLGEITRKIRESLEIDEILRTAVTEVRRLLDCDRVVVIERISERSGKVIQKSTREDGVSSELIGQTITGLKLVSGVQGKTSNACICDDVRLAPCSLYTTEFRDRYDTRSCIEVPIYVDSQAWGLITASQYDYPRQWEQFEIELMQQLADQMGVAIAQAQLLNQLEIQVEHRTNQLSQTNDQLRQEIQERIQVESALRESQQKLQGILESADEAIISIDSQQRIVMYNHGAEQIFGYTFEEVCDQPLDILIPEAFRQIHQQHVRNFAASPDVSRQMAERQRNVVGRRKSGAVFPAEASISKLQTKAEPLFTVIMKDITDQREAEAALRRSEEQLRLMTNALPALICYVDTEQRYQFNNQTYEEWFQIPIADLRGRHIREVIGDAYYTQVKPHVEAALSGQQVKFEAELTMPNGQSRYLLATYIPEFDDQGQVNGFFGLSNDISDRKATERMKDEFVSVVGHELRTPLTSIHGSLVLLASKQLGTLTPQGQEFLEISLKNTQRLTRLINDVLDLERIESGRTTMSLQLCNLAELMQQAVQAMQGMAKTQDVVSVVEPLEVDVWADPDHLIQVLTNLLSNAIKFSSAGTAVWLSAVKRDQDILVQVKDQGRGIPTDKLETIFERFHQVDASDTRQLGGTGLGLAICRNIVQRHGGKIWAESSPGKGSTFFFTLPIVQ